MDLVFQCRFDVVFSTLVRGRIDVVFQGRLDIIFFDFISLLYQPHFFDVESTSYFQRCLTSLAATKFFAMELTTTIMFWTYI